MKSVVSSSAIGDMVSFKRLTELDLAAMREAISLYSRVFEDPVSYESKPPSDSYLVELLLDPGFYTIAALDNQTVVGALSAYTLRKFEQERSEVYIYDLAVDANFRRRRVATGMIEKLRELARQKGVWMIYVQADLQDEPAIRLYTSLGR